MTASKVHAALTAILLGTAAMGVVSLAISIPAEAAASVSPKVGAALKEAQALAARGDYKGALAKVNEAEAVPGRSAEDNQVIAQMKQYIGIKSGDVSIGGAAAAKVKLANDYNARKYHDVIEDASILRKFNALDANSLQVVAQAYYLSGDKQGCVHFIKTNFSSPSDPTLELLMRCAYDAGDDDTQRQALEQLVAHTGKPEYWNNLLKLAERSRGLSDHNTLDINRLRMMTGNVTTRDEYTLLAQLALQLGFPAEAETVIEKGMAAKVLNDPRSQRLLDLAKSQAAADAANQPKAMAAAKSAPQGDGLIKIGEDMIGQGKAKDAISVIQEGLKKPLKDPANGQMRLGQAYLAAGDKSQAEKAFDQIKTPERDAMIAHLWALEARSKS